MDFLQSLLDQFLDHWRKTSTIKKSAASGWYSGNAVCCTHNHESADKRSRGGMIVSDDNITWHCFNCGFKSNYHLGFVLSNKFKTLLSWVGFSSIEISGILLETMRQRNRLIQTGVIVDEIKKPMSTAVSFKKAEFPESVSFKETLDYIENNDDVPTGFVQVLDYVLERHIDIQKYDFYWTPVMSVYKNRAIIPFIWGNDIIGHTARIITKTVDLYKTKRYISSSSSDSSDFVFNINNQKKDWKFVIVVEGPFDAMSIDGVALMGSEITQKQLDIIKSLDRQVIVLPDWDKSGMKLIGVALQQGWSVSFPVWNTRCKDANSAVIKYGKLFTLHSIFSGIDDNQLSIRVKTKLLGLNKIK